VIAGPSKTLIALTWARLDRLLFSAPKASSPNVMDEMPTFPTELPAQLLERD